MKNLLVLLSLILVKQLCAQEQALRITDQTSGKQVVFKENKRVNITTFEGRKISGRLKIEDAQTIFLEGERIDLTNLKEIKRNPFLASFLISGLLIYAGAITAGFGMIIGIFIQTSGFLLTLPAAGLIYAGIKSPNMFRNYKNEGNWILEVISLEE
jgi:hypothetical protein